MQVAIIGCGGQGNIHATAFAQLDGVKIVGCCDVVPERAKALAEKFGAQAFTDANEMLSAMRPDIVSVCTYEDTHAPMTIAALKAGAHVLCEKMLASSLDEARAMVQEAKETGKLLATQFNYRHIPSVRWLKNLLDGGALGEPLLITMLTHALCHHHGLDLLRFLFGEVTTVQAALHGDRSQTPYLDRAGISADLLYHPPLGMGAVLRFEQGYLASIASSIRMNVNDFMVELHLVTTKGRLALRRMRRENISGELETNMDLSDVPPFPEPIPFNATFPPSIHSFVAAVRGETVDIATGEDGLRVMEIEHGIIVAHRTGQKVILV